MPYEVAGNAGDGIRENQQALLPGGGVNSTPGDFVSEAKDCVAKVKACLCCMIVVGIIFEVMGVIYLVSALTDTRGAKLKTWSEEMNKWQSTGALAFHSLDYQLLAQPIPAPPGPPPPGALMTQASGNITPAYFGEATWDDGSHRTPSPLQSYTYTYTAQCPGGTPNQPCLLELRAASGRVLRREIPGGAAQQIGPTPRVLEAKGCQWYDSDYYHPMATVGMGSCNTDGPHYGPECVDERYLDASGCPNDIITSQYWTSPWDVHMASKPRFTYDSGKCWDYTDCFCTGCGYQFKTDTSNAQAQAFTGYGYYYKGAWTAFPQPLHELSGNQRAVQCKAAMDAAGMTCPADEINLVCFNAGGFPKKSCKQKCDEQSPTAKYTPAGTVTPSTISNFYGPFGTGGQFPPWIETEGQCAWQETKTLTLSKIQIAVTSDDQFNKTSGGKWDGDGKWAMDTVVQGNVPLQLGATVAVEVEVTSKDGPVYQGAVITNGCSLGEHPSRCFGNTQKENLMLGIIFIVLGNVLIVLPCLAMFKCAKAIAGIFS